MVEKNYSNTNLGCGQRPSTGISWVFENVTEAIILEDDCVPHATFFRFCDELLALYRDDERIMQICGNNFQFGHKRTTYSYFFSRYSICWGWATWRRAWKHFDIDLNLWPLLRETPWLLDIVENPIAIEYWRDKFDKAYDSKLNENKIDYWDYQWSFACWAQSGLSIMPSETLVSNIGCGPDGTHTKSAGNITANLPTNDLTFPLKHPPCVVRNKEADKFFNENIVITKNVLTKKNKLIRSNLFHKLYWKISSLMSKI